MRTRREQVQAYRFMLRRIVSALLSGEPERADQPMRRLSLSLLASAMIATIGLAAAGIWGLVTGQSSGLSPNTLVIEDESNARYVYLDDRLHPVANYASARLILGDAAATERRMSQAALADLPRGPLVGIPGGPDAVPPPDLLLGLPWRICSVPPTSDLTAAPTTTLVIGEDLTGGEPLGEAGRYVATGEHQYLLWNDTRLLIRGPSGRIVLGLGAAEPSPVTTALINTIAVGPDIVVPRVPGAGGRADFPVDGEEAVIGRVFRAGGQYYVLTQSGLVAVGEVTAQLRLADGGEIRDISAGAAGRALAPRGQQRLEPPGFPQTAPDVPTTDSGAAVCAVYRGEPDGSLTTTLEVFPRPPAALTDGDGHALEVSPSDADVVATADRVHTIGGRGTLAWAVPNPHSTVENATVYLITPQGIRYPLTPEAVVALGYGAVEPLPVPLALVEMVPLGPTLDPIDAGMPIDGPPAEPATGD